MKIQPVVNQPRNRRIITNSLLLIAALCSSIVWSTSSPVGSSPDEPAHIYYSWGVISGQVMPWNLVQSINADTGATNVTFSMPSALTEFADPNCYINAIYTDECTPISSDGSIVEVSSYMARYPFAYYAIIGTVMKVSLALGLSGESTLLVARLVSGMASYGLLAFSALLLKRRFGSKATLLPIALLLVPNAQFLMNSINPNGFEISGLVALTSVIISIRFDAVHQGVISKRLQLYLLLTLLIGCWTRPLSVVWACLVLPLLLLPGRDKKPVLFGLSKWTFCFLFIELMFMMTWFYWEATGTNYENPDIGTWRALPWWLQMTVVVSRFGELLQNGYGLLGWTDYELPTISYVIWLLTAVVVLTIFIIGTKRTLLRPRIFAVIVICSMALIYIQSIRAGFGWQGRYWLAPLAAATISLVPSLQGNHLSSKQKNIGFFSALTITAVLSLHAIIFNLWRYQFGLNVPFVRFTALPYPRFEAEWYPPIIGLRLFAALLIVGFLALEISAALICFGTNFDTIGRDKAPQLTSKGRHLLDGRPAIAEAIQTDIRRVSFDSNIDSYSFQATTGALRKKTET